MAVSGYVPARNGGNACDVSQCKAACCRAFSFRPDRAGPCEYLTDRDTCELHEAGGVACKPFGCAQYPQSQGDVDTMNWELAVRGLPACLLRVE